MIMMDSQMDLFEHYNIDCIFECMFLATMPENTGKGIGRWLVQFSYEFAQQLSQKEYFQFVSADVRTSGKCPRIISAIFTSAYSQQIGRKLHFNELSEVKYDDIYFDGVPYSQRITDSLHKSAVVMTKKL